MGQQRGKIWVTERDEQQYEFSLSTLKAQSFPESMETLLWVISTDKGKRRDAFFVLSSTRTEVESRTLGDPSVFYSIQETVSWIGMMYPTLTTKLLTY